MQFENMLTENKKKKKNVQIQNIIILKWFESQKNVNIF